MTIINMEQLSPFFEQWDSVKERIEACYTKHDKEAVVLMNEAIYTYMSLLQAGGKTNNQRTGESEYILLALNGEERIDFIKKRIASHYAYIQLDTLFLESKKKAARYSVMKKKLKS
ncbi:YpoC family protein [Sporosarcina sp. FA9]|uniref:YpoC family protein n=1 Tax=Sporosarcina sp. FA9 TaxID=3413030 RepID=UPI003F65A574